MAEEPLGYDAKGWPVWAVRDDGKPCCGVALKPLRRNTKRKGNPRGICLQTRRMENGRCRLHGGTTPKGEESGAYKDGRYSRENVNRDALIVRLMNTPVGKGADRRNLLDQLYDVFADALAKKDFRAAKDLFEQIAGGPRQTVEHKMDDAAALQIVGRIAVRWEGKPMDADKFLKEVASELAESR